MTLRPLRRSDAHFRLPDFSMDGSPVSGFSGKIQGVLDRRALTREVEVIDSRQPFGGMRRRTWVRFSAFIDGCAWIGGPRTGQQ